MADIYHTFLDDEQEAERDFRKAHGADECPACGGEGVRWSINHARREGKVTSYRVFTDCDACDGLGVERVSVYVYNGLPALYLDYPIIRTRSTLKAPMVCYTEIDQHVLMGILQRFAPKAYAAEMRRQGVTL